MPSTYRSGPNETHQPTTSGSARPAGSSAGGDGAWWRTRISGVVNARKGRVSDRLAAVAETVRRVGEPLQDEPFSKLGAYAGEAARAIDWAATELRDRDLDQLADDVRGFARSRPAVFVGAGLAVGLVAGRFLRSADPAQPSRRRSAAPGGRGAAGGSVRRGGRDGNRSSAKGGTPR